MEVHIACVVEGHGDRKAVPLVVRRIAQRFEASLHVRIPPPIRIPKTKLVRPHELEPAVTLAARTVDGRGAILVVLDSDTDCPAIRGPELLQRATLARQDIPLAVVLAKQEVEAWFPAAAISLRGQRGLAADIQPPASPETIQNAKAWLSAQMRSGRRYSAILDQPALAAHFDLEMARQADSFDKCYRDITRLLASLRARLP